MFFVVVAVAPPQASNRLTVPESHLQPKAKEEADAACRRGRREKQAVIAAVVYRLRP